MEVMRRFDRFLSLSVFPLEDGSCRRCTLVRRLIRLHFLLLLSVLLLDLLSLLSVALFHLLFLSVADILLRHLLVFFFLLLLQSLVFLVLFGG